jgi:hypothetical protein
LNDGEKGELLSATGETPALVLTDLMFADKLLAKVERMLQPSREPQDMSASNSVDM